ncbi:MAG TPA: hypothetical protein VNK43_06890, partial [Gemmatimonadales bacterium]|nr:hypothetical protein [Gemmatimonadales bacterium]
RRAHAGGDARLLGVATRGAPHVPGVTATCARRLPRARVRLVRAAAELAAGPTTGGEVAGAAQRRGRESLEDRYMAVYNVEMARLTGSCGG